jgi:hypothetical protein
MSLEWQFCRRQGVLNTIHIKLVGEWKESGAEGGAIARDIRLGENLRCQDCLLPLPRVSSTVC